MGLKVAVAGKGGSGKTTVSALLSSLLARSGEKVLLVDLDSDPNLASAVGVDARQARPLVHRGDLVAERTGSSGQPGGFFILNPTVSDLVDRFAIPCAGGIALLPVGTIENAGEGCFCPQAAFVKALVRRIVLAEGESVVLDLEAGLEPFGRSAVEGMDLLLVVVEPGMRSVETAKRIATLSAGLGIRRIGIVANKVHPGNLPALEERLREAGLPVDVRLGFSDALASRDLAGASILDCGDSGFESDVVRLLGLPARAAARPPGVAGA